MDPMERTYGRLDGSEVIDLWTSGLPILEILDAEARLFDMWRPVNDNGDDDHEIWGVLRDHWSGDLREWRGQADDISHLHPVRLRLVPREQP